MIFNIVLICIYNFKLVIFNPWIIFSIYLFKQKNKGTLSANARKELSLANQLIKAKQLLIRFKKMTTNMKLVLLTNVQYTEQTLTTISRAFQGFADCFL